jgi:prepilin-type N-terminal cleavage/methylation domain-containing protein
VSRVRNAFTLVELLIVIIILAVVATIAVPKFTTYSQMSKEASLRDTLRTLRDAQQKFHSLYEGWPNDIEDLTDPLPPSRIWPTGVGYESFAPRVYQGSLIQQGQAQRNLFLVDPVGGNIFSVTRLSNGELRIRSSTSGNDSRGIPYNSY